MPGIVADSCANSITLSTGNGCRKQGIYDGKGPSAVIF